jgi:hypothetical protein
MGGACSIHGRNEKAHKIVVEKRKQVDLLRYIGLADIAYLFYLYGNET